MRTPTLAAPVDEASRNDNVRIGLTLLLLLLLLPAPGEARLRQAEDPVAAETATLGITQRGCMSLNQAVESVRRRGDVQRVLSANTRVEGDREVHYIKVMTKNGTVRTERVNGCRR